MKNIILALPKAPKSIQKGSTLKSLLDKEAISCLAHNISQVYPAFNTKDFIKVAQENIEPLGILERGHHLSHVLRKYLPTTYATAIKILLKSLTPPLQSTSDLGLSVFFYLPHICYVANYGLNPQFNNKRDPFNISMKAQYELTQRFSAEFSIRHFLIKWPKKTIKQLMKWSNDKSPHVRRLCSEGSRPRLPWAIRLAFLVENPRPILPILEALKDDPDLYVRKSVANHLGDIAIGLLNLFKVAKKCQS
jgi:3-methyladenine DNA glycosylase AlkC